MNGASAATSNFAAYMALKFGQGFFASGFILAQFVLMNELIGPSFRSTIGIIFQAFFAVGILVFTLMAYFIRQWWQLTIASSLLVSHICCESVFGAYYFVYCVDAIYYSTVFYISL